jgi:hypothetical protein
VGGHCHPRARRGYTCPGTVSATRPRAAAGALARTAERIFADLGVDPDNDHAQDLVHVQARRLLVGLADSRKYFGIARI